MRPAVMTLMCHGLLGHFNETRLESPIEDIVVMPLVVYRTKGLSYLI